MAKDNLTPRERAVKRSMNQLTPKEKGTMMETVEKRLRKQAPKVKEIDLKRKQAPESKEQKKARRKVVEKIRKNFAKESSASEKKAKKAVDKAKKQAIKKGSEATIKGAGSAGKAAGVGKVAGKIASKVAAPLQVAAQVKDIVDLFDEDERKQVLADYKEMADDNIFSRSFQSALNPVNTFFGTASALADAGASQLKARQALDDAYAMGARLAPQRAASKAKGERREASLGGALDNTQMRELEKAAVKSPELLKQYAAIQSPEQAKELYASAFGEPEPTAEEVVDKGLATVDEKPSAPAPATKAEPTPAAPAPKAEPESDFFGAKEEGVADKLAKGELTDPKKESLEDLRKFNRLFKEVHGSGTSYDSNSETDRKKKAEMDAMLDESGGIKNLDEDDFTQFALDYYREYNYV